MNSTLTPLVAVLAAVVAGVVTAQAVPDAQRAKAGVADDPVTRVVVNQPCRLFTPAEVARYLGKPVKPAENAAGANACQWPATDDDGDVRVQVLPWRHYETAAYAQGFKKLPRVGHRGYVVPESGGWKAAALAGDSFIAVTVAGGSASEGAAVALLQESLKRRTP